MGELVVPVSMGTPADLVPPVILNPTTPKRKSTAGSRK
jgi:hypothetical protein